MTVVVDGGDDLRVVRHLHCQTRTTMEGLLARKHSGIARLKRSQLQGILVGLGTRVDKKQLVVVVATDLSQSLSQLHLQLVDDRVGVESYLVQLLRHLLYIVGVGVTDRDHSVSAVEVEILLSVLVPHLTTLTLDDVHVEERIYVK